MSDEAYAASIEDRPASGGPARTAALARTERAAAPARAR